MTRYILKRIALAFFTGIIILTLVFVLIKLLPVEKPIGNDTARNSYWLTEVSRGYIFGSQVEIAGLKPVDICVISGKTTYYYSVAVYEQYFRWISNILTRWDWGVSQKLKMGLSAGIIIGERLPYSVKLNIVSSIISIPLGILVGIWAALKKNKPTDHIISTVIIIFISVPSFVLITLLMYLLCYQSGWLPTQWPKPSDPVITQIKGYILPTLCLSFGSIAGYARNTRAELCEVMSSEYLLLARTKGLTRAQAIRRHALRNAMVPIIPGIVAEIIGIFVGGSMILERLYGIPGIGSLFIEALQSSDWNILFVVMAFDVTIGLLAGILVDVSYGFVDPRIRMGAKK